MGVYAKVSFAHIQVRRNFKKDTVLKEIFLNLLANYTDDESLTNELWNEIDENYTDKKRHYHNLSHLDNLYKQLFLVKEKIESWDTILFTLFYHDIIYNALNSDNEEKSAQLAEKRLKQINVPRQIVEDCKSQILATKKHIDNGNIDTNYFLDADLSILGQEESCYKEYCKKVRLEYLYYPSIIYNKGRIEVLKHFLNLNSIFKTEHLKSKFENKARINIFNEIDSLEKIKEEFYLTYSNQWCFCIEDDGDWYEFFHDGAELLKNTNGVEITNYYPGFFDSGYCRFNFKNVKLNLEFEGMLGIDLRTEPNPTNQDIEVAREIYEILKQVRNKNYA